MISIVRDKSYKSVDGEFESKSRAVKFEIVLRLGEGVALFMAPEN